MLRLKDVARFPDPLAEWPLPIEVPFIESRELFWVKEDLYRYTQGRIRGRSYLIAGHRGAGKTALIQHATEQLVATIMREAVKENGQLEPGPFQRPLLVKLHGPSMLELPDQLAKSAATNGDVKEPSPVTKADSTETDTVQPGSHAALVQIATGLYRALAAEVITGFRAHARLAARKHLGDQAELATQLALDLDGGLSPARLRFYWRTLGRLSGGVLWPETADDSLKNHGINDQGLREIIALATASQTFQVCTGRLSYSETRKNKIVQEDDTKAKGESNLKNALLRLGTLGLGALTSVSIFGVVGKTSAWTVTSSLLGGLAVWLLGILNVNWSFNLTRTDDQSADYSFIRDFSLGTLGRDLPVVINRLREAGLAPVFVVDELDKVVDAPTALTRMIGQLKHLVADFGFFCFLVDRDCSDKIEAKIRASAYPMEHTLFGDRLLMRPDPTFMLRYITGIIDVDQAEAQSGLARIVFGLYAIHQARLNLTELMRQLAHASLPDGALPGTRALGDASTLLTQRRLVVATVQVAINLVLRSPKLSARMGASPSFAQLAIDTLYYPSCQWDNGVRKIDPSHDVLRSYLEKRRGASPHIVTTTFPQPITTKIDIEDLDLLHEHLVSLLNWLVDLETLRSALRDRNAFGLSNKLESDDVLLVDVPPRDVKSICRSCEDGTFCFLFTRDGDPIVADSTRLDITQHQQASEGLKFAIVFTSLLKKMDTKLDELAHVRLIMSVNEEGLNEAIASISAALRRSDSNLEIQQHLSTLLRLQAEVKEEGEKLGVLLTIVGSLSRDVNEFKPILPAIARLIPFGSFPTQWIRNLSFPSIRALPSTTSELEQWTEECHRWLLPAPGSNILESSPDYDYISKCLLEHFELSRGSLVPDYRMLLQAVRCEFPIPTLASDLNTLTAGDWSRLALLAVPTRDRAAAAPYWLFIAGLRGLGFGQEDLTALTTVETFSDLQKTDFRWLFDVEGLPQKEGFNLAQRIAKSASSGRPPGILLVERKSDRFGDSPPSSRRPTLIVDADDYDTYLPALNWLIENDILVGVSIVRDDEQEDEP